MNKSCPLFKELQIKATKAMQPVQSESHQCVVMLLTNLAEPQWVSVPCDEDILPVGVCVIQNNNLTHKMYKESSSNVRNVKNRYFCLENYTMINNTCYAFIWDQIGAATSHYAHLNKKTISIFMYLYNSIALKKLYPLVFGKDNYGDKYLFKFYKKDGILDYTISDVINAMEAFYTHAVQAEKVVNGSNLLYCFGGGFISNEYICDGINDCPNSKSDEDICSCNKQYTNSTKPHLCKQLLLDNSKVRCSYLFQMDKQGICNMYTNKRAQSLSKNNKIKLYDNGSNDNDEIIMARFLQNKKYMLCKNPNQIPCMEGHPKCYSLKEICMYRRIGSDQIDSCENGAHLENCKAFQCGSKFKCPNAYCIPWINVCDGVWDCPGGYDETYNSVCGNKSICEKMYKCRNMSHMCLHIASVCDGYRDCYFGDDELLCGLKMLRCPVTCKCLIFAIDCRNISISDILLNLDTVYLSVYISYSNIFSLSIVQKKLLEATFIKLPLNALEDACYISPFNKLVILDLSFNYIKEIKRNCLSSVNTLKVLLINNNKIKFIGFDSLTNFKNYILLTFQTIHLLIYHQHFLNHHPVSNY